MLVLNVPLALVSFCVIPFIFLATSVFSRLARRAFRTTRETTGDVTAELQEEISGIRQAQAFNRSETNIARFREHNRANRDANVAAVVVTAAFAPTIDVLSTLAIAVVIGFGGYLLLAGELSVGVVAAFLIYVQQFFRPIQLISQVYTQLQAAFAGAERIYAILDEPEEAPDPAKALVLDGVAGRVTFEGVSFAYDPSRPVLRDISFDVAAGQTVALVGRTGAGKTTIANLIPRFYEVSRGHVRVDGQDVRDVTRASLRRQMAMVLQEPFLFGGTVADNIAYGRPDATRDEIRAAAEAVDAHTFIEALPHGYDTRLSEQGSTLSQGQRQLLSFARAVLADPQHPNSRRGDQQHRYPYRGADPGCARPIAEWTNQRRHRPPLEHHPRCRSDPGDRVRSDCRARQPHRTTGRRRPVRRALPAPVPRLAGRALNDLAC